MRFVFQLLCRALCFWFTISTLLAQTVQYGVFTVGGPYDQGPNQHSILPGNDGSGIMPNPAQDVLDTDLATLYGGLTPQPKAIWVFGQCYGAGMIDDLFAQGGTQSGIAASNFNQLANYPDGNGTDFVWAYLRALTGTNLTSQKLAIKAAYNDPWGPSPTPFPARSPPPSGEVFLEQPVYFSVGTGADDLRVAPQTNALAILWASFPNTVDQMQIAQAISVLATLGYGPTQIFVLFKSGNVASTDPVGKAVNAAKIPNDHVRAATKTQLNVIFPFKFQNRLTDPNLLFFFVADHGANDVLSPRATPKMGNGGSPVPSTGDIGVGNSQVPPEQ